MRISHTCGTAPCGLTNHSSTRSTSARMSRRGTNPRASRRSVPFPIVSMTHSSGKTILTVEDHRSIREVLVQILGLAGYTVLQAENGKEGVRQAEENVPDLILMDLAMPVMDGWEALRHLKQEPRTARIPVVALTADQTLGGRTLEETGFCGYLPKPVTLRQLREEIERCLALANPA